MVKTHEHQSQISNWRISNIEVIVANDRKVLLVANKNKKSLLGGSLCRIQAFRNSGWDMAMIKLVVRSAYLILSLSKYDKKVRQKFKWFKGWSKENVLLDVFYCT